MRVRILHTGDWHLGRTLLGADLSEHHAAFLDFLVDTVRERQVDLVLVAGDVYDRAVPPVGSVGMLSWALERLAELARVVVIPGNHDSAERLGFASGVMNERVRIVADVAAVGTPVLVEDSDGPVAVYGIPFLQPAMVRYALSANGKEPLPLSHEAVIRAAMDRIRTELAGHSGTRSIVVAHAFVGGAEPSDSERDIRVGGVDRVSESAFDGVDYVALGHLHGPQRVGGQERIRYAGSPLAFSFGERDQRKSVTLVDVAADGTVSAETIPAPVPRRLVDVRATIAEIESGAFDHAADAWTRVAVTDAVHPDRMYARVTARLPHALAIAHEPPERMTRTAAAVVTATSDPVEISAEFVRFVTGGPPSDAEAAVVRDAYESVLAQQREDR